MADQSEPAPFIASPPLMTVSSRLALVICTHNRSQSLIETLESIYNDGYAGAEIIDVLVVANNCLDDTLVRLTEFRHAHLEARLRLSWVEEPQPGKSYALNTGIANTQHAVLCFIDDDQVVESGFISHLLEGIERYPEDGILCGRIWPAWDGSEPQWVHAREPYAIPIRPFPEFDLGRESRRICEADRYPSGGNISVRRHVLLDIGGFSTDLGPTGHNLAGGEDHDFLRRATAQGHTIRYLPKVRQLHAVDAQRMSTPYTLRKSYLRSRASFMISKRTKGPQAYMLRKIFEHSACAVFTTDSNRRFFYMVRVAASAGELAGSLELWRAMKKSRECQHSNSSRAGALASLLAVFMISACVLAWALSQGALASTLLPSIGVAGLGAMALLGKSLADFSQTGPQLRHEVLRHFRLYSALALMRLTLIAFGILFVQGLLGTLIYSASTYLLQQTPSTAWGAVSAVAAIVVSTGFQFCRHLLLLPASLMASSHYRSSRLYPLWRCLTPRGLKAAEAAFAITAIILILAAGTRLLMQQHWAGVASITAFSATLALIARRLKARSYPKPRKADKPTARPNVLMIGSDTLRADRIGKRLTPFIESLAQQGTLFTHCYVPCARTAPSLVSLLTGTWPHTHGIRDNYVADDQTRLKVPALAHLLRREAYTTAVLSDWCGADMGKFDLGFEYVDLPEDQWNLKLFIRQGPKDLRLFLSMFVHNEFGKALLPEIHFLGGVPLTDELGVEAARLINRLGASAQPFLLNVFFSTTHPPFGSEYPYYLNHSTREYAGESKFAMARLTDPWEILRRQAEPREAFDLEQITALYDGCVNRFDDEVRRLLAHLDATGLRDNTILVLYSDHGMEFFEHESWGQGNSAIGEQSARVPLLIIDPRTPGQGRVEHVVRSIDLMPTLLDVLGLPAPTGMDGVSLSAYLHDADAKIALDAYNETGIWMTDIPGMAVDHLRYPNLLEMLEVPDKQTGTMAIKPEFQRPIVQAKDRMLRRGQWKLVYQPLESGCKLLLFDLVSDPGCISDVSAKHAEIVVTLWKALRQIIDADPDCSPISLTTSGVPPNDGAETEQPTQVA